MAMTGGLASALAGPILLPEVAFQVEGPGRRPTGAAAAAGRQHRGAGGSREAEQAPPARGGSRPGWSRAKIRHSSGPSLASPAICPPALINVGPLPASGKVARASLGRNPGPGPGGLRSLTGLQPIDDPAATIG